MMQLRKKNRDYYVNLSIASSLVIISLFLLFNLNVLLCLALYVASSYCIGGKMLARS